MLNKPLLIFLLLFAPFLVQASVLYLEPEQGDYYPGDVFMMSIRIDSEDECINTVKTSLSFDSNVLEALDFSEANSILSFWLKRAEINHNQGVLSLAGGIPGGFCGQIFGDPRQSNLIGRVIFQVLTNTNLEGSEITGVNLQDSSVLLNDGLGTPARLSLKSAVLTIQPGQPQVFRDEWVTVLKNDNLPPEDFKIEITRDSSAFNNQYFLVFSATDNQTGVDYFSVKEGEGDWQLAQSPYLLQDQTLKSQVIVRAVDKAGNSKIIEFLSLKEKNATTYSWFLLAFPIAALIFLFLYLLSKKNKKEKPPPIL
ncbi:MAG: hypothetical protein ABH805_00575 [Candidatus Nealsonbacteria bacterium]